VRTAVAAGAHRNAAEWAAILQPMLSCVTLITHQTDNQQGYLRHNFNNSQIMLS